MLQKKDNRKILFFRESSFKVAELIFNYPNRIFHLRKLAKDTHFSTTAIVSAIKELNRFNIIKIKKTNLITQISANLESEAYVFYKKIFNLYRLERYGLVDLLKENFNPEAIVLFGSFAKGEDIEESDIDLLVITNREKKSINLNSYEKELNRKISLHILSSLKDSSAEFKNAIANGIVLHGYIKVV